MRALAAGLLLHASWPAWSMEGANFLQSGFAPWGSRAAAHSLANLRGLGADWVALVPFLAQSQEDSCDITLDAHYDLESLRSVIRQARTLGFRVAVKPQFLVPGKWAGDIAALDEAGWQCWFDAYREALLPMARLAQTERVELFVAGTELKGTEMRSEWRALLRALRREFKGRVSYVFHAPEDARRFSALQYLDWIGLSLYPPLGNTAAEASRAIAWHQRNLRRWAASMPKPVWFAEVGVPSRARAGEAPWQWNERTAGPRVPDMDYQASALALWLEALAGDWNEGVMIWNWMSHPFAGGLRDTDFTPQNKPAEVVLRCFWRQRKTTECIP